ncbi:hypothetical protein [Streptomyces orinoci]|uniref:Integral membrane protein n=1 Tax=Streptomyces orinoci TaxID=67339 RepID=A0ABV3JXC8_STRON|nr:hypothetical protein [Streptomyces orinoci]
MTWEVIEAGTRRVTPSAGSGPDQSTGPRIEETPMPATATSRPAVRRTAAEPLRTALWIDSWSTGAFGVLLLAGAPWLSGPLGLPVVWSVPFGVAMLAGAAALALLARRPRIPAQPALMVVAGNALSCAGMLVLAGTDLIALTGEGRAFLVVGAVVVAVFAEAEYVGYRRMRNGS